MFSGSYLPEDVTFLLKIIDMPPTAVEEKERLIQSGKRHYSEMISREAPPSPSYRALFFDAFERHRERFAGDLVRLAREIARKKRGAITLVSLARAGTPIGVLLGRILRRHFGRDAAHYSISIIRDRGIDEVALTHILDGDGRDPEGVVFVDGWTGKGVIARELARDVALCRDRRRWMLDPALHVVADIAGVAGVAATGEDYLIPSSILNAVVSGLISRSILNDRYVGPGEFHGCLYYGEFAADDLSRWFVDRTMEEVEPLVGKSEKTACLSDEEKAHLRRENERFLRRCAQSFGVPDPDHVKVGLGETTRVLLRRVPGEVLVRDGEAPQVRHVVHLAREKGVPWREVDDLPYAAVAFVKDVKEF